MNTSPTKTSRMLPVMAAAILLPALVAPAAASGAEMMPGETVAVDNTEAVDNTDGTISADTETVNPAESADAAAAETPNQEAPTPLQENEAENKPQDTSQPSKGIVNGEDAVISDAPWYAKISTTYTGAYLKRSRCGATIISPRHIVTAAHCMEEPEFTLTGGTVTVGIGSSDEKTYAMQSWALHPDHLGDSYIRGDVALVTLDTAIADWSENVSPAPLPTSAEYNWPQVGAEALIVGFGATGGSTLDGTLTRPDVLQKGLVDVQEPIYGQYAYPDVFYGKRELAPGKATRTCSGDSGGPVTVDGVLAGIISFGPGGVDKYGQVTCNGLGDSPSGYVRVRHYLDWLLGQAPSSVNVDTSDGMDTVTVGSRPTSALPPSDLIIERTTDRQTWEEVHRAPSSGEGTTLSFPTPGASKYLYRAAYTTALTESGGEHLGALRWAEGLSHDSISPYRCFADKWSPGLPLDPIEIRSENDLLCLKRNNEGPGLHYKQVAPINMTTPWTTGIGSQEAPFTGVYDGGGNAITNFTQKRDFVSLFNTHCSATGYVCSSAGGLFGFTKGATLTNVRLEGADVGSSDLKLDTVGGLVGVADGTSIDSSVVSGTVTHSHSRAGGIVGHLLNGSSITNSCSSATVDGNYFVGGLVGVVDNSTVSGSCATGKVNGRGEVGGLVGRLQSGTVSQSYALGDVDGQTQIGGLIGRTSGGLVADTYARGHAHGKTYASGLVGYGYDGDITQSYATGHVTGGPKASAGLVGGWTQTRKVRKFTYSKTYGTATVSRSYFDTDTTGKGNVNGKGMPLRTPDMSNKALPFAGVWSGYGYGFQEGKVWGQCSKVNDGYPFFIAEHSANPCLSA